MIPYGRQSVDDDDGEALPRESLRGKRSGDPGAYDRHVATQIGEQRGSRQRVMKYLPGRRSGSELTLILGGLAVAC